MSVLFVKVKNLLIYLNIMNFKNLKEMNNYYERMDHKGFDKHMKVYGCGNNGLGYKPDKYMTGVGITGGSAKTKKQSKEESSEEGSSEEGSSEEGSSEEGSSEEGSSEEESSEEGSSEDNKEVNIKDKIGMLDEMESIYIDDGNVLRIRYDDLSRKELKDYISIQDKLAEVYQDIINLIDDPFDNRRIEAESKLESIEIDIYDTINEYNLKFPNNRINYKSVINKDNLDEYIERDFKREMSDIRTKLVWEGETGDNLASGKIYEQYLVDMGKRKIFKNSKYVINNDKNPKIPEHLKKFSLYDISTNNEDADAKNYDTNIYRVPIDQNKTQYEKYKSILDNQSDKLTDKQKVLIEEEMNKQLPVLQQTKYFGYETALGNQLPLFTKINGIWKLHNVMQTDKKDFKNEKEWINKDFNKDLNIYYKFAGGIYKYEINKDPDIIYSEIKRKGINGETLYKIVKVNKPESYDEHGKKVFRIDFKFIKKQYI
jgi:hypothetical protein